MRLADVGGGLDLLHQGEDRLPSFIPLTVAS
jgi:hypothetical protein